MITKKRKNSSVFGKHLASLRKKANLTQIELSEKLGVSKEIINYLENRAENPTMEQIKKIAVFFDVSADELIFETPKKSSLNSKIKKQFEKIQNLPENKQKIISDMLDGVINSG